MVEYFKTIDGRVTQVDGMIEGCWINLVNPTNDEVNGVISTLNVDPGFLRAALDPEESSRVEVEDEQTLIIVDIPVIDESYENKEDKAYSTLPLGIVVTNSVVITVCLQDTSVLREIANDRVRNIHTLLKTRFVFQILLRVAGRFLNYLRRIERNFTQIERRLYASLRNEDLLQLLSLSKSLIYFSSSLKSNEVTMEKMLRGRVLKLYEDDRDILEDAIIEIKQATEMSNIYSTILSGTMEAYGSVLSNNLNVIMKVLTVITIIMTIPNIIFGFYGMNVDGLPVSMFWWFPIIISVVGCVISWHILKKKNLY